MRAHVARGLKGVGNAVVATYTQFRASWTYLLFLAGYITLWLYMHWWHGWDRNLGDYNSFLSTDASVAFTIYTIESARTEVRRRRERRAREEREAKEEAARDAQLLAMHTMLKAVYEITTGEDRP